LVNFVVPKEQQESAMLLDDTFDPEEKHEATKEKEEDNVVGMTEKIGDEEKEKEKEEEKEEGENEREEKEKKEEEKNYYHNCSVN